MVPLLSRLEWFFVSLFSYAYSFCNSSLGVATSSLLSIFEISLGLLFSVQFSIKFYFLVHVSESLSCIRRCRADLVSIVFPVFFARFLSHRFWKVFGPRLLILYFFFLAIIVRANSNCTRVFSTCIQRSVSGCHVFRS